MIYVLMTSELPWQRKDTITFFTCLCISVSLNKLYDSILEIFWDDVLRVIKTVNKHAIDIIG